MNVFRSASNLLNALDESTKDTLTDKEEEERRLAERRAKRRQGQHQGQHHGQPPAAAAATALPATAEEESSAAGESSGGESEPSQPSDDPAAAAGAATASTAEGAASLRPASTVSAGEAPAAGVPAAAAQTAPGSSAATLPTASSASATPSVKRAVVPMSAAELAAERAAAEAELLGGSETSVEELLEGDKAAVVKVAKAEILRLRKEGKKLRLEMEDAEERLEGMAQELQAAGDALAQATKQRADLQMQGEEEAGLLRQAKETDRAAAQKALEERDAEVSSLSSQLVEARSAARAHLRELDKAHAQACANDVRNKSLEEELREARAKIDTSAEALRAELRRVSQEAEDKGMLHASQRREFQRREAQLEQSNADLGTSLAQAQRRIRDLDLDLAAAKDGQGLGRRPQDDAAAEEMNALHSSLEAERSNHKEARAELRALKLELSQCKASADEEVRRLRRNAAESEERVDTLQRKLREHESSRFASSPSESSELLGRLEAMGAQLLKKQILVDDLSCARAALAARLRSAEAKAAKLHEAEAKASADPGGGLSTGQLESGLGGGLGGRRGGSSDFLASSGAHSGSKLCGQLRQRGTAHFKLGGDGIDSLPLVAKHKRVARVAGTVDRWSLWAGRYLRGNATARLYFLVYLVALHAWVFGVTLVHVHNFEEVHGDHQMLGGVADPTAPSGQLTGQLTGQVAGQLVAPFKGTALPMMPALSAGALSAAGALPVGGHPSGAAAVAAAEPVLLQGKGPSP